jgi:hypothetical protein
MARLSSHARAAQPSQLNIRATPVYMKRAKSWKKVSVGFISRILIKKGQNQKSSTVTRYRRTRVGFGHLGWASGHFKPRAGLFMWAGPVQIFKDFPFQFKCSNFENTKPHIHEVQKFPNMARWWIILKETSILFGPTSKSL